MGFLDNLQKKINAFASQADAFQTKVAEGFDALDKKILGEKEYYREKERELLKDIRKRIDQESLSVLTSRNTDGIAGAIQIPSDINMVDDEIFKDCKSLTKIDLSDCEKLSRIGKSAFDGCKSLSSIKLPQSLIDIEEQAFRNTAVKDLDLLSCCNLQSIGSYALAHTEIEDLDLSSCCNLQSIGTGAFMGTPLHVVDFSVCPKLTVINSYVVDNCENLEKVILPKALNTLGTLGFCNALRSIDMTKCTNLLTLDSPLLDGDEGEEYDEDNQCYTFYKTDETLGEIIWDDRIIPIEGRCHLEELIIPYGVTEIDADFFEHLQVQNLYLPPTLKECVIGTGYKNDKIYDISEEKYGYYEVEEEKHYGNVYCYSTECVDSLPEISYGCFRLYLLPEIYDETKSLFTGKRETECVRWRYNEEDRKWEIESDTQSWYCSEVEPIDEKYLHFYEKL